MSLSFYLNREELSESIHDSSPGFGIWGTRQFPKSLGDRILGFVSMGMVLYGALRCFIMTNGTWFPEEQTKSHTLVQLRHENLQIM